MSDCGARVVLLLASLVLAPFAWFSAMAVGNDWRMASLAGTVTSVILAVVIWRKYVRWTVLRSSSSLAVVLLVVAQVFLWRPLWAIGGCGMDDALRTAQSLAAMGLGLIALIFLWWGGFLWKHTRRSVANSILRRLRMTSNAVRLTVGIALVPLLPGLFFIGVYALQDFGLSWPEDVYICLCYEACAILAVIVWWLLWRPVVEWNRRRRVLTGLLAVAFLASPGRAAGPPGAAAPDLRPAAAAGCPSRE